MSHILYAVQDYRNMNATMPEALTGVRTVPNPAPTPESGVAAMEVGSGPSTLCLSRLSLAAATGGILLVGDLTALAGSRSAKPGPELALIKTP